LSFNDILIGTEMFDNLYDLGLLSDFPEVKRPIEVVTPEPSGFQPVTFPRVIESPFLEGGTAYLMGNNGLWMLEERENQPSIFESEHHDMIIYERYGWAVTTGPGYTGWFNLNAVMGYKTEVKRRWTFEF